MKDCTLPSQRPNPPPHPSFPKHNHYLPSLTTSPPSTTPPQPITLLTPNTVPGAPSEPEADEFILPVRFERGHSTKHTLAPCLPVTVHSPDKLMKKMMNMKIMKLVMIMMMMMMMLRRRKRRLIFECVGE